MVEELGAAITRFSVERYHHMIERAVLTEEDHVELLEGVLVEKMTEGPAHAFRVSRVARLLTIRLGMGDWIVRAQHPITTDTSEPEPDLAIVRDTAYEVRHPNGADVAVVIEVSDSSLARDRNTKVRIYAAAAIERYIIINIPADTIECFEGPVATPEPHYLLSRTLRDGTIELGPITVTVQELLHP